MSCVKLPMFRYMNVPVTPIHFHYTSNCNPPLSLGNHCAVLATDGTWHFLELYIFISLYGIMYCILLLGRSTLPHSAEWSWDHPQTRQTDRQTHTQIYKHTNTTHTDTNTLHTHSHSNYIHTTTQIFIKQHINTIHTDIQTYMYTHRHTHTQTLNTHR